MEASETVIQSDAARFEEDVIKSRLPEDVRTKRVRQIATAVGDGATAAMMAEKDAGEKKAAALH